MTVLQRKSGYLHFWSLESSPFLQRDPTRFFSGSAQQNALAQVERFVASGHPLAIINSDPGCGTTRLLEYLSLHAGVGDRAVNMVLTQTIPAADEKLQTVWLVDRHGQNGPALLDDLPVNMSVVIGAESLTPRLLSADCCRRATIIELARMSLEDTKSYVTHSLQMVGGRQQIFSESAINRLHECCEGRIRDFSYLAENALRECWIHRQTTVTSSVIERLPALNRCAA